MGTGESALKGVLGGLKIWVTDGEALGDKGRSSLLKYFWVFGTFFVLLGASFGLVFKH